MSKAQELNAAIEKIPICKDGKAAVRELVEKLSGERLAAPSVTLQVGQIWSGSGEDRVMIVQLNGENNYSLVLLNRGHAAQLFGSGSSPFQPTLEALRTRYSWRFKTLIAESLSDYIDNGGKL